MRQNHPPHVSSCFFLVKNLLDHQLLDIKEPSFARVLSGLEEGSVDMASSTFSLFLTQYLPKNSAAVIWLLTKPET